MLANEKEIVLRVRGLYKSFLSGGTRLNVLNGVDLDVFRGELIAIMGASGVGKSTLLHIMGIIETPTAGNIEITNRQVCSMTENEKTRFRNLHIGFVFQYHHLLPEFTTLENVLMPAMIANQADVRHDRAEELLEYVGLHDRMDHRPGELSGGECQRVAMVRALIMQPDIVLADEPSGNLDARNSESLHEMFRIIADSEDLTFVVMTHDEDLADRMDRSYVLEQGIIRR